MNPELVEAARRYVMAMDATADFVSPVGAGGDTVIRDSLQACIESLSLIPEELEKTRQLAAEAENEIERDAYLWQGDVTRYQIETAARVARERLSYYESLKSEEDYQREKERCADGSDGTIHWFKYYAWGYDPRAVLKVQPFYPFDFQERYIRWLDETVMHRRKGGVVEKSRDQGATVGALDWSAQKWLFVPGFCAFLSSATEDLIDSKKDPDTLFEKVRFQLRLTFSWMLPKGFSLLRDMPYMNIANPENGATITGGAPTENVGRQRRATVVIADEFQGWPNGGFKQNTALSSTSFSVIKLGTPYGTFNQYYVDTHTPSANVFVMDWREHPWKDQRWYNALPFGYVGQPMTAETIAQEVDRNYEASQPGRVIKNLKEEYCFITWRELVGGFKPYKLDHFFFQHDGRYKIPTSWNWGRIGDYGISAQTEDDTHIWAYSLFARPQEAFPFNDSLFFFYSLPIEPIGASELEGFAFYSQLEREIGVRGDKGHLRSPQVNDMSHEAKDAKDVLLKKCGDSWRIPKLDFVAGVSKLRFHCELTDSHLPNPFRPVLMGRSRIYFVAPDDEYQMALNPRLGHFVTPSKTQKGFKRLRREFSAWHFPAEE
ncbi:MAG: hypothetical protein H0W99_05675, partial [Acidobacteria bacterium]|nr:hypothetical protein [Acidobacteriota bacterium]